MSRSLVAVATANEAVRVVTVKARTPIRIHEKMLINPFLVIVKTFKKIPP